MIISVKILIFFTNFKGKIIKTLWILEWIHILMQISNEKQKLPRTSVKICIKIPNDTHFSVNSKLR